MKRSKHGIALSALCLIALLTACGDGTAPTESSTAEMTEETVGAVSETAADEETVSESTAETTSESFETTTAKTTAAETTTTETTTAETTTAAPETTVTEAETTEFKPYTPKQYNLEYPDIVPLYLRDSYTEGYESKWFGHTYHNREAEFDIEDSELLYLTENAHFIRCELLFGDNGVWTEDNTFEVKQDEAQRYWSTNVNYPSFIDYAKSVFTDEYIQKIEDPELYEYNDMLIPTVVNIDGQVYCSDEPRGINPAYKSTVYHIYEQTEDKVTIERETIYYDMEHGEDDPDYHEDSGYTYIDLVKTPDGWRYDYFPMYDE